MDFEKKDRGQLKEFFVKNAIPTERNFSDLIDASLNQQEDGIRKPDSSPLSIEASGDTQKVINFYPSFDDPDPAWSLALNPRSQAADPTTASGGFTITDGSGTPRLFIENSPGEAPHRGRFRYPPRGRRLSRRWKHGREEHLHRQQPPHGT